MKPVMLVGLLAAVVGVGAAGWILLGEGEDDGIAEGGQVDAPQKGKQSHAKNSRGEGFRDGDLEDRVAELESEVADLRRQLRVVSMRTGAPAALSEGPDSVIGGPELADPEFQDSVREIVADEREREREAEMDRRRERSQQRTAELLDELVTKANINPQQREKIDSLWTEERDQMFSMFIEARNGERDFREVRQAARGMRESTDQQAREVLSEEQYAVYEEMRPRGPGGWGGRGRGRGAGPPQDD